MKGKFKEAFEIAITIIVSILMIIGTVKTVNAETMLPDYIGTCDPMGTIEYNVEMNEYKELFETFTAEDMDLLARVVMCEAGHSNLECAEATTSVILNRVLDQTQFRKVNTISEVVNQRGQFTTRHKFAKAKPNALVYEAISNVQNYGARVIRNKLAEQGWDFATTDYLFFSVGKSRYGKDHLFVGTKDKGQHHYISRAK